MSMFSDISSAGLVEDIDRKIEELRMEEEVNEDVIKGLEIARKIVFDSY